MPLSVGLVGADAAVNRTPAEATVPQVWGAVTCPTSKDGTANIDWTARGDTNYPDEVATIVSQSIETEPPLEGKTVQNNGTVSGVQVGAAPGTYTMTVQVQWSNHTDGDLVTASSTPVTVGDECAPPAYECPEGTEWVDADGDGVVDEGECESPPREVPIPADLQQLDPCNPPDVTDNVAWATPLPVDTEVIDWSESADGRVRTASLLGDGIWEDGTTEPKSSTLKQDSGEECPTPDSPKEGTATASALGCVKPNQARGVVLMTVFNTADETGARSSYTVNFDGATSTIKLADGADKTLRFSVRPGTYSWSVQGDDGTKEKGKVTVKECKLPPPPPDSPTPPPDHPTNPPHAGLMSDGSVGLAEALALLGASLALGAFVLLPRRRRVGVSV